MELRPLDNLTLKDRVIGRLRRAILAGSLKPDAVLSERDIAAQLGVSRTPVREAFAALEREGLLVLSPHREVRVVSFSSGQRSDARKLRALLEGYALYRALAGDAAKTGARLGQLVDRFDALLSIRLSEENLESTLEDAWRLDAEFHTAVIELAGDELLQQIWKTRSIIIWLPTTPPTFSQVDVARAYLTSQAERHRRIVESVDSGDPLLAAGVLTRHVLNNEGAENVGGIEDAGSVEDADFLSLSTQLARLSNS
jgi:DNA-binding GntR family transcriptional regulator